MALFSSKAERVSVVLIDINSSSVGGALAHIETGTQPTIYYSHRLPIQMHGNEDISAAMLRTLDELTDVLIKKGAPILRQQTKSGHIDRIFVSIGAPWQATSVRTEHVNEARPFVFTKAFLTEITRKSSAVREGYVLSGESVIATLLNGYEVEHPFGKKVTRAELTILSSLVQKEVADSIESVLRKTYHTHALTLTAFAPVAYTVFRDIFPHEKDFLVLDISGEATDIVFIKRQVLVNVASVMHGVNELTSQQAWLDTITTTLREFSTKNILPRTLFLLAEDDSRDYVKNLLDSPMLCSLWLTDESLAIIPILPSQFSVFIKSRGEAKADIYLSLLALFSSKYRVTS